VLVFFFLMALANSAPSIDVKAICKPARDAALPEERAGAFQSCLREETEARDEVRKSWGTFSTAARSDCAFPSGVAESYVEMLTCLQLESGKGFGSPVMTPALKPAAAVAPKPVAPAKP